MRFRLELWERWQAIRAGVVLAAMGRLLGLTLRAAVFLTRTLIWQARIAWARMRGRTRLVVSILALVLISGMTNSTAPSVSAATQGIAVLLVAIAGLWMILTSHRGRRW